MLYLRSVIDTHRGVPRLIRPRGLLVPGAALILDGMVSGIFIRRLRALDGRLQNSSKEFHDYTRGLRL